MAELTREQEILSIHVKTKSVGDVTCDAARAALSAVKAPKGWEGRLTYMIQPVEDGYVLTPHPHPAD